MTPAEDDGWREFADDTASEDEDPLTTPRVDLISRELSLLENSTEQLLSRWAAAEAEARVATEIGEAAAAAAEEGAAAARAAARAAEASAAAQVADTSAAASA
eukprot:CAMPEP_0119483286 /NCGR_PEP_ID=MMETSP1344-20130328/10767_1 /TAXON_ID=236787 /ORGANISM="Florenciella parvula, Strain CCMP2471" /LENGTH=102 /DNA_ID=CAMNT_0007517771 /DNA_START=76 /DNA_END=380 /DNA_ORIENTATION=+